MWLSYRAVADGEEAVLHRALPLLPNLPQAENQTHGSVSDSVGPGLFYGTFTHPSLFL